ncbi:MAG TPA: hypothetical protein VL754_01125 [Verrucomicrobiae bacterium]|nr:hypothetical protein [Verrucomicrobiae bacterium]
MARKLKAARAQDAPSLDENVIGRVKRAGVIILGASANHPWIEVCYEGDLMHTERFALPGVSQIFVEELPQKTILFEPPRTMIYLDGPHHIEIRREGDNIVVRGHRPDELQV